jgi:HK97 family phage major capsid protein
MNLIDARQKLGEVCDAQNAILQKALAEGRPLNAEEQTAYDAFNAQIDAWQKTVAAAEAAEKRLEGSARPADKREIEPVAENKDLDDCGFKNFGEFLHCVKNGDPKGRFKNLSTTDVGIMIPPRFAESLLSLNAEAEIVMPRATVIPAGDPPDAPFSIPYLQQGDNGALGGVALQWTAEAQQVPAVNDPRIQSLTLTPAECSGLATINNKTLDNWQAAGGFMTNLMRLAWISGRDRAFLNGTGAGQPLGLRRSPGALRIARNTAATVRYVDFLNMLAVLYDGPGDPIWIINQSLMPTIMTMTDPNNNYIYNGGDATKGVPATLLGIPVKWNGKTPTMGNEGDVVLAKLNYYMIKPGAGPFIAISEHSRFGNNQTQFRIVARVDGQLWVRDPLLLEDGVTRVSPVVILR